MDCPKAGQGAGVLLHASLYWVQVGDAAPCPAMPRTASLPLLKNDLTPNISRAEAEAPSPESKPHEHLCPCREGTGAPGLQSCVLAEGPSPENLRSDDE